MKMLKLFNDRQRYQSLVLDTDDFLGLLGPEIGESNAMQLGILDIKIEPFWQPQEISVFENDGTVDIPDISIWKTGLIVMNEKAYQAIGYLMKAYGEFLPCKMLGGKGYLFHCLTTHEFSDTEVVYQMHGDIFAEVESLDFQPPKNDVIITGLNKVSFDMFCNEDLTREILHNKLEGLVSLPINNWP